MPNGLPASEQYHGTHSFSWGTLGLYDEENPGDPDAPTGPWGSPPITRQHGTDGWYYANPAQYYVYDGIVADSTGTPLPFLNAGDPAGPIQINNNLNYIANFSLLQYSLKIIHHPIRTDANGVQIPTSLSGEGDYWGDIEINGDNSYGSTPNYAATPTLPGLTTDGVTGNHGSRWWTGDFDAFSQQTIKAIPKDTYGFIEWVEPSGQSVLADRESAETTVTITPEGDNTGNQIELAARFGQLPISTFLIDGALEFGNTITLTDVSHAPSGTGNIVSAEFSNDSGISFGNVGKGLELIGNAQTLPLMLKSKQSMDLVHMTTGTSVTRSGLYSLTPKKFHQYLLMVEQLCLIKTTIIGISEITTPIYLPTTPEPMREMCIAEISGSSLLVGLVCHVLLPSKLYGQITGARLVINLDTQPPWTQVNYLGYLVVTQSTKETLLTITCHTLR